LPEIAGDIFELVVIVLQFLVAEPAQFLDVVALRP